MSKEERKTLKNLKKDERIIILKADESNKAVVMDRSEHDKKMLDMLTDQRTYKKLDKYPGKHDDDDKKAPVVQEDRFDE